jgi:hypothetical protein
MLAGITELKTSLENPYVKLEGIFTKNKSERNICVRYRLVNMALDGLQWRIVTKTVMYFRGGGEGGRGNGRKFPGYWTGKRIYRNLCSSGFFCASLDGTATSGHRPGPTT